MIATFEDEPYRAPFSGNVIELCPVGALTSTQYRFEARPVGDPERADRLRALPGRLQHQRDDARGQGQAHPLAQPPRGRRGLALRQGPLRLRASARAPIASGPAAQGRAAPVRAARLGRRARQVEQMLRSGGDATVTALSGSETVEQAYALAKLLRQGLGAHSAVLPEAIPDGSTPSAHRSRRSATRRSSSCSATSPSSSARRSSTSGSRPRGGTAPRSLAELPEEPVEGAVLVTDDAGAAWLAATSTRPQPSTCRVRRTAAASPTPGARPATASPVDVEPALVIISGDEAALDPDVRALRRAREDVIGIGMFEETLPRPRRLVLPGTSYLERDGTTVNLEGRLQRQRRAVIAPVPGRARLDREARRALRRRALAARLDRLRRDLRDLLRRHLVRRDRRAGARCPRAPQRRSRGAAARVQAVARRRGPAPRRRYRPLFSGAGGRADARARNSSAPTPRSSCRRDDARLARSRNGDDRDGLLERDVRRAARPHRARPRRRRRPHPAGRRRRPARLVEVTRVMQHEAWWIAIIEGVIVINLVMVAFAYTTWLERRCSAGCSCASARTAPARRAAAADRRPDQARPQGGVHPASAQGAALHPRADRLDASPRSWRSA